MMSSSALLFVIALASPVDGFSPSFQHSHQSKLNYVDGQAPAIGTSTSSLVSRVDAAIESADLVRMKSILSEMYHWQDECTEETNQTNQECDTVVKAQRDVLIGQLEDKIASVFMTAAMTMMVMNGDTDSLTLEDQVQSCLSGATYFGVEEMQSILNQFEELQR